MKLFLISFLILITLMSEAQSPYTYKIENGEVILNGSISKYILINDSAFAWYKKSTVNYKPDSSLVNALKNASNKINFIIFGGTWCEDTHYVLPKFFAIQEQANFPDNRISFFAADRNKHVQGNISEALGVFNVPSIIVMYKGKEVGRVVEYGKTGKWDKELAEIINSIQ